MAGGRLFISEMESNGFMSVQINSREFWFKEDVISFQYLCDDQLTNCGTMGKLVVEVWDSRNSGSFCFKLKLYVNSVPLSINLEPDVFIGSVFDFVDNLSFYRLLMFGEVGVRNYGREFISSVD